MNGSGQVVRQKPTVDKKNLFEVDSLNFFREQLRGRI